MFKNYLKVAARALSRQKGYAAINVVGLALGLACCLLIARFVAHEMSYDSFNEKADTLYRVTLGESEAGGPFDVDAHTSLALGPALEGDLSRGHSLCADACRDRERDGLSSPARTIPIACLKNAGCSMQMHRCLTCSRIRWWPESQARH